MSINCTFPEGCYRPFSSFCYPLTLMAMGLTVGVFFEPADWAISIAEFVATGDPTVLILAAIPFVPGVAARAGRVARSLPDFGQGLLRYADNLDLGFLRNSDASYNFIQDPITGLWRPITHPIEGIGRTTMYSGFGFIPTNPVSSIVEDTIRVDIERAHQIAQNGQSTSIQVFNIPRHSSQSIQYPSIFYRGHDTNTSTIFSPLARQEGTAASEALYQTMISNGFRPEDIAWIAGSGYHGMDDVDAILDPDLLLPQYRTPLNVNPRLGNAAIPTSLNPGVSANFYDDNGLIYVIQYPSNSGLTAPPAQVPAISNVFQPEFNYSLVNQLAEEEWVFFNQIPQQYIIGTIDPSVVPRLRIDAGTGLLIVDNG